MQAKLAQRAAQTKELVVEQLKAEEEAAKASKDGPKELGDIDTDDEKDPEGEYEAWRIRELARIRSVPRLSPSCSCFSGTLAPNMGMSDWFIFAALLTTYHCSSLCSVSACQVFVFLYIHF